MKNIRIYCSKSKVYEIESKDVWNVFMLLVISIIPLMSSTLKFANIVISFIVSIIFFVLVLVIAGIVFVKKREII